VRALFHHPTLSYPRYIHIIVSWMIPAHSFHEVLLTVSVYLFAVSSAQHSVAHTVEIFCTSELSVYQADG
jgi:hypothetical protein